MLTERRRLRERLGPGGGGEDRLALHMIGELGEIVRALGDGEQGHGAELAVKRVVPAGERLDPGDRAAGHRDLRLEADLDLVLVERPAQIDLEPVVARGGAFGAILQHMDRRPLPRLRLGERGAGAAQQGGGIVARLRSPRRRRGRRA